MTTKEWLMRAWKIDEEIKLLLQARDRAYDQALSITAPPKDMAVRCRKLGGNVADGFLALDDQIGHRVRELMQLKQEVLAAISQVRDGTLRRLLIERYIHFKTWEQVGAGMNYSYTQIVQNLHPKALWAVKECIEVYTAPAV